MRDPKRIREALDLIEVYWEKHSDLRLGQLLCVIAADIHGSGNMDPFYLEDSALIARLRGKLGIA